MQISNMSALSSTIMREAKAALELLAENQLLIDANPLSLEVHDKFELLSWNNKANISYLFAEYSTLEQYLKVVENRDFLYLFHDGGVVQVFFRVEEDCIVRHRLCYYPCPFQFNAEDWAGVSIAEIPTLMSAEEILRSVRMATPVRFDFDANFSDEKHAHSHFTINRSTCRVPAYGPVSFGHFLRFVLRYFYERDIEITEEWEDFRPKFYSRTLTIQAFHELHIDTAMGM